MLSLDHGLLITALLLAQSPQRADRSQDRYAVFGLLTASAGLMATQSVCDRGASGGPTCAPQAVRMRWLLG